MLDNIWAPSSEFVSSSIPSWQILTAHAQPFRGARDLAFCLKVPLDSLLVWASSEGSGETARMRRLAWTFAARIGDKYQICLTRSIWPEKYFIGTAYQNMVHRDYYMTFFVAYPITTRDSYISPRAEGQRTDMGRRLIWGMIRKMSYHNLFIIYFLLLLFCNSLPIILNS